MKSSDLGRSFRVPSECASSSPPGNTLHLKNLSIPHRALPHISVATSTTRSSLCRCTSSEIGFPRNVLAKPHCGLRQRFSSGTYLAAASMRRLSTSFGSSADTLVLTSPSTILLGEPLGKKRNGSKPPERSSSYSRKYASTSTWLSNTSATGSYPPCAAHWPMELPRHR